MGIPAPAFPARLVAPLLLACALLSSAAAAQTSDDFFNDATLQDLSLTVSARDWADLKARADEDTYYTADLRWNGVTVRNIGLRSRGAGTRNGIKPGLRLDFNRYLANQEFLGLRALVLDNAYTDPSTMREALAMKLYTQLGLFAPREAHARLFVNNEYAGLYIMVEPVDRTFILRVLGDAEGNVEDGGFLYEYKWLREYGFEYLGPDLAPYAAMYSPRTHETDAASRLYAPLEALTRAVNDVSPDRLQPDLGGLFDLSEFVKFLAIQRATSEIDGFIGNWSMSNFYLYRFRDGRPTRVLPWDEDHAFWAVDMAIDDRLDTNVLTAKVMQDPALRRLYLDTLASASQAIAQTVPGDDRGWLEREADRLEAKIAAAAAADPVSPFTFDEFTSNIAGLRGLLRVRPGFVLCQASAALDPEASPACPAPDPIEISAPLPR